jgi:hypothetical protein
MRDLDEEAVAIHRLGPKYYVEHGQAHKAAIEAEG